MSLTLLRNLRDAVNLRRLERSFYDPIKKAYDQFYAGKPGVPTLTPAQEKEILAYFKEVTGQKIPLLWHRYFYARNGIYAKDYLPTSLYKISLLYRANRHGYRDAYADKNMADRYLSGVAHPEVVVKNMNGYFYAGDQAISREAALERCRNLADCLIKPSLETHGNGVRRLEVHDGQTNIDGMTLTQLFDRYGKNWCIQRFIRQHPRLAALNPTSVNTIRVLTYRSGMEILVLYTVIRIGRAGQEIDNQSAGGISALIHPDGRLARYAYGAPGVDKLEKTDVGVQLEGYEIPQYAAVVETVKQLHLSLPFFNLVGWDMSVGEDGTPILVEWNVCTELSQTAAGTAFGPHTDRILRELYRQPNDLNPRW